VVPKAKKKELVFDKKNNEPIRFESVKFKLRNEQLKNVRLPLLQSTVLCVKVLPSIKATARRADREPSRERATFDCL
jgi:hypothetical protein